MADTTAVDKLAAATEGRAETIQARVRDAAERPVGLSILNYLGSGGYRIPGWWSTRRDVALRRFWKESDHLAGALYTMIAKMTSIPFHVSPVDPSNPAHMQQAAEREESLRTGAEFGEGWHAFYAKFIEDLLSQDNGGFAEIIGPGDPSGPLTGSPLSLAHLDSYRCQRTGDPQYPVLYQDVDGTLYKLHYTRVLFTAQMPSPIAEMYGVGFCLHRDASVMMADGSHRRIVDIVNERDPGPVMSLDEYGKLVPRMITNWYQNQRGERRLINIRGNYAKFTRGIQERNSWVTEDHPILTPGGWVHAGELRDGDEIVTGLPTPNRKQYEFLVGSLMGDGSLPCAYDRPRLSLGQGIAQEEWFHTKANAIGKDFGFVSRYGIQTLNYKGVKTQHEAINGQTLAHAGFIPLREAFYPEGKKVAPLDWIREFFSPLMLATWYMDDGSIVDREANERGRRPHARLATNGFTVDEVEQLVEILNENGYYATVISARGDPNKRNIRITADGSERLFDDIAPYVPECMRYKLPDGYGDFDPSLWELGDADVLVDTVIVSDEWNHYDSRSGNLINQPEHVYCIDVDETHNFISAGIVVHNCAVSRCVNVAQTLIDILVYKQEKLGSRPYRAMLITQGGLDPDDVTKAFQVAEFANTSQGMSRYSKIPVIGSQTIPDAGMAMVELSKLPEGFDEETSLTLGMATIALAFGVDARELFPSLSSGSTRADALLQHLKQRGKGPGQIIEAMEAMINYKYLPPHLKIKFDFQDDAEDQQSADIRNTRAKTRQGDLVSQVVNARTARQGMLADGELTRGQFEQMELEDGRLVNGVSVLSLLYLDSAPYNEVLKFSVANPEDVYANDREAMFKEIAQQRQIVHQQLAATRNFPAQALLLQCEACLNALQKLYEKPALIPATSEEAMQAGLGLDEEEPLPGGGRGALPGTMRDARVRRTNPATPNIRNEVNTGTGENGNVMNKPTPNKNEQDKELDSFALQAEQVQKSLTRLDALLAQVAQSEAQDE